MKNKTILLLIILLCCKAFTSWSQEIKDSCMLTYIANEGFLIETENHKVLIDALFGNIKGNWCDQPNDSVSNQMMEGISPFDNIDVVLVTHKHSDHFNDSRVIHFLMNNPTAVLICPDQVNALLKQSEDYSKVSNSIRSFKSDTLFDTTLTVNKINIRVFRFTHGKYMETDSVTGKTTNLNAGVENFGYLIETDGFTLLHSGDCFTGNKNQFIAYDLLTKKIDVAFFDRVFLRAEGISLINEFKDIRNIVLMHIEPGKGEYYKSVVKDFSAFIVFSMKNESRIIYK
jgi:L-ascorbate metabolism protein UlaG (beta-lactamase superfamily)